MTQHKTGAYTGIILCMHPVSEGWHYIVTLSLIGWAYTQLIPAYRCHQASITQGSWLPFSLEKSLCLVMKNNEEMMCGNQYDTTGKSHTSVWWFHRNIAETIGQDDITILMSQMKMMYQTKLIETVKMLWRWNDLWLTMGISICICLWWCMD